jgi:hypothetical protein
MSQATASAPVSGQTGGTCQASGPYKCNTHPTIIVFFKSEQKFTACPMNNGHSTVWTLVQG